MPVRIIAFLLALFLALPLPAAELRPVTLVMNDQTITTAPWLREHLPADALFYLRIPNPWAPFWGAFSSASGKAAQIPPYLETMGQLREGLAETLLPEAPEEARPILALALQHARSPLEIIAQPSPNPYSPVPRTLAMMKTDFTDVASAGAFLQALADSDPTIEVAAPMDASGNTVLKFNGMPGLIRFQSASGRLILLIGDAPDPKVLDTVLAGLQPLPNHPMYRVEREVDDSGQGIFAWVNAKAVMAQLGALKDHPVVSMVQAMGGADVNSLSLGLGGAGGLGRLKLNIEMPRVGFRNYVPQIESKLDFGSAGTPKGLLALGLPSGKDLAAFETGLASMQPPEKMQEYYDGKKEIAEKLGFSIEQLLDTFGQDLIVLSDKAGFSIGLRLRDRDTFEKILAELASRLDARHETRSINGQAIHHLSLPSLYSLVEKSAKPQKENPLLERYLNLPQHYYWVDEGDYLVFAGVPQVLIDRHYIPDHRPVAEWLREDQRMDPGGALLLLSLRTSGLHNLLYQADLGWMQVAGDYLQRPVDLFTFPSAMELGLPEDGAYSLKLTSSQTALALEFGYEHNPIEFIFGGDGYTGIAVLGVLAAVAIPAYNDYTLRAKVASAVADTQPLRQKVLQSLIDNQRYPSDEEISAYDLESRSTQHYLFYMIADSGIIGVQFDDPQLGNDAVMEFQPEIRDGQLFWNCVAEMNEKYLPAECKE